MSAAEVLWTKFSSLPTECVINKSLKNDWEPPTEGIAEMKMEDASASVSDGVACGKGEMVANSLLWGRDDAELSTETTGKATDCDGKFDPDSE